MKKQKSGTMLEEYLKDIKKALPYQTFADDEKERWEIVVFWTLLRTRGSEEQKIAAIGNAYFAFIEGIGGHDSLVERMI